MSAALTASDLLAAANGHRSEWVECSECGHVHYNRSERRYEVCPLAAEGCDCRYAAGDES